MGALQTLPTLEEGAAGWTRVAALMGNAQEEVVYPQIVCLNSQVMHVEMSLNRDD